MILMRCLRRTALSSVKLQEGRLFKLKDYQGKKMTEFWKSKNQVFNANIRVGGLKTTPMEIHKVRKMTTKMPSSHQEQSFTRTPKEKKLS